MAKNRLLKKTRNEYLITNNPYERNNILLKVQGNNHVGNCDQFSYMALEYLVENSKSIWALYQKPFDIALIGVTSCLNNFGHVFVALSFDCQYPLDQLFIRKEKIDVWICDAWANIACQSYKYPFEWIIKMLKWNAAGKALFSSGKTITPIESQVLQLMKNKNKNKLKVMYKEHIDFTRHSTQ